MDAAAALANAQEQAKVLPIPEVVDLNVGGRFFTTRLRTLRRDSESMLAAMFSGRHTPDKDSQGRFFIDRDPTHFHHILNYLRHEKLPPALLAVEVLDEAEYYQVQGLIDWCAEQTPVLTERLKRAVDHARNKAPDRTVLALSDLVDDAERLIEISPACSDRGFCRPATHL